MRRTIAVVSATGALLFGGAGVAHATVSPAPATTTTLADDTNTNANDQHSDNAGLWGLLGLLGLGGLVGLKRRKDTDVRAGVGTTTTPGRGV